MNAPDPAHIAAQAEAVFADIAATRMAGLPVVHPGLSVAMRGAALHEGCVVGVLVTPWFMNLVAFPAQAETRRVGEKAMLALPSGGYEAIWAHEPALGGFWTVSLFSPMFAFADMDAAIATADAAMAEVMTAPPPPAPAPEPQMPAAVQAPVSRRGLFRLSGAEAQA
ncbi:[NiFe]-hydrogenase assembly chaperone HybE [Novosphingobium sp. FSY-8]|uniref:[NiFe]-hydrogenase assembly chaperone HybE n=1 Tax=Novosphingobium ovatum TaxID=1908523 RepID=A0ABW9X9M1_9SPHN|nr:[NiFe]-hydrogenase assembly chaperone HybE [Novosphingobium ovatum]NBC35232.1 [NiFe]-hydrogenase assembly chaperone HybE [Novosphingobium ovatum]